MRLTIDALLVACRQRIVRLTAGEAYAAVQAGTVLIDVRSSDQRRERGIVPGAIWYPRNVLEWRVDPSVESHDPAIGGPDEPLLLLCAEGYQTSLAAATLVDLGFTRAGEVVDGFEGWEAAGLPIVPFDESRDLFQGSPLAR